MAVLLAAVAVLVGNLPFGYWRGNVRKFSLQWVLAIHVPVVLGIVLRLVAGLPFEPTTVAVFVVSFFSGQSLGQRLRMPLAGVLLPDAPSSCLLCDLARLLGWA